MWGLECDLDSPRSGFALDQHSSSLARRSIQRLGASGSFVGCARDGAWNAVARWSPVLAWPMMMASAGSSVCLSVASEASFPVGKEGHGDPELPLPCRVRRACAEERGYISSSSPSSSLLQLRSSLSCTTNYFIQLPPFQPTNTHLTPCLSTFLPRTSASRTTTSSRPASAPRAVTGTMLRSTSTTTWATRTVSLPLTTAGG